VNKPTVEDQVRLLRAIVDANALREKMRDKQIQDLERAINQSDRAKILRDAAIRKDKWNRDFDTTDA
jgi:hypothetical protein